MKKILFKSIFLLFSSLLIFSCASTDEEPVVTPEPAVIEEPEVIPEETPEEDEVEDIEESKTDEEYLRSIESLDSAESVSKQEFTDDKTAILEIIENLSEIMENQDVKAWLEYIDPESIAYYSNPVNLRKAQKKLPNKLIELKTIGDYFKFVFIPSRKRSEVDEIRYISKTNIKAVQVKEDSSTVVYYYFAKINERWYVHLPTL